MDEGKTRPKTTRARVEPVERPAKIGYGMEIAQWPKEPQDNCQGACQVSLGGRIKGRQQRPLAPNMAADIACAGLCACVCVQPNGDIKISLRHGVDALHPA